MHTTRTVWETSFNIPFILFYFLFFLIMNSNYKCFPHAHAVFSLLECTKSETGSTKTAGETSQRKVSEPSLLLSA